MKAPFTFKGSIRQLAADLCWETQQDPLAEWMRDIPFFISEREKERSCFVVMGHSKKLPSIPRFFVAHPTSEEEEKFHRLAERWRRDVMFVSDTVERIMHPAYQRIIGMGANILPLLLNEVVQSHEHWFWALESITGEDPVRPEDSGDVPKIARAWAEWGRQRGYIG